MFSLSNLEFLQNELSDYKSLYRVTEAINIRMSDVVYKASQLLSKWDGVLPVRVDKLIEQHNMSLLAVDDYIYEVTLPKGRHFGIFTYPRNEKNNTLKNVMLAHLLGRYVLRQELPYRTNVNVLNVTSIYGKDSILDKIKFKYNSIINPSTDFKSVECSYLNILCNIFTVGLLIPQQDFFNTFKSTKDPSIDVIAARYQIPIKIVKNFF